MKGYTKGTWALNLNDGNIHGGGHLIAQIYGATEYNHENNAEECFANAKLILNAPTMLKLLEELMSCVSHQPHTIPNVIQKIRDFLSDIEEASNE